MQKETADNSAVFETLRDLYKLVASNHLRTTQEWLSVLMRVDTSDPRPRDALLKEVIDLRTKLLDSLSMCENLGIDRTERASTSRSVLDVVDDEDIIWEAGDVEADKAADETASTSRAVDTEKGEACSFSCTSFLNSSRASGLLDFTVWVKLCCCDFSSLFGYTLRLFSTSRDFVSIYLSEPKDGMYL